MSDTIDELLKATIATPSDEVEEVVDMDLVFDELADMLRPLLFKREIKLKITPQMPPVLGDRGRVREIFLNLMTNAAKFCDKSPGLVEVGAKVKGEECIFAVCDNGSGIPADDQQRIFSPFRRLRSHQHLPGSGLGLYFTRNLAEQLGGRVWVESEEGVGSSFFVALRKAPAE